MSAAVWSLTDQTFVSVPTTPGQAWDDRAAIVRSGRRRAEQLEVRELEHRCANGHDRDDYEGSCPFCDADEEINEHRRDAMALEEKCDALEQEIEDLKGEAADLRERLADLAAQREPVTT